MEQCSLLHINGDAALRLEDEKMSNKRLGLPGFALACAVAVVVSVYFIAERRAMDDVHAAGDRQLQIIALDLESVLEKFETLPFALSFHPDVLQALGRPADVKLRGRLNSTLQAIQQHSKVSAIYLMDRTGNTIASSNWDQPFSFVGKNFAFRPYFSDAINGAPGRFYGIGNATGEPGYFISQPVYRNALARASAPIGVITVKISLAEFEQTWGRSEEPIALADASGVVFLSNRAQWRYYSMRSLGDAEQEHLAMTLQYAGRQVKPVSALPKAEQAGFGSHVSRPVGRLGWQLMLFPSERRITRAAAYAALAAAMALTIAGISLLAIVLRRRHLEVQIASRQALQQAAEELETNIAQRTQDLLRANLDLEVKYAKLKETEHLLRSTQNELVQAGKLAMLGQMAAGVTHELNQPLAAIRAFADNAVTFLKRGKTGQASENLSHISEASARMGEIIGQLKGFARKSHETVSAVDLAKTIGASALLLENDFSRCGVVLDIDEHEPVCVVGDSVRLQQVFINLLRNALDAVETAEKRQVIVTITREGNEAVARIRDTGPGITENVAQHLFEPFFTTKTPGKGLGLGLAISSSIVQAMNGQLGAHNCAEGGAEFVVRLPVLLETENTEGGEAIDVANDT